jgi:hypothetical protein
MLSSWHHFIPHPAFQHLNAFRNASVDHRNERNEYAHGYGHGYAPNGIPLVARLRLGEHGEDRQPAYC